MSVAIDNTGKSAGGTSTTSLTIGTFAVGAGANRCIFLAVSQWKASDLQPTATFNTTENFVPHDSTTIAESGGTRRVTLFKLVNPSNVTASIVVSWGSAVDEAVAGATSWTGVDQTTPFGTAVKASSSSATSSTVTVPNASGDVVHDAISVDSGAAVGVTANQTQRWRAIAAGNTTEGAGQSAAGTGTGIACTWTTFGGVSKFSAQIGVAIRQVSAGGTTIFERRTFGSVGRVGTRRAA